MAEGMDGDADRVAAVGIVRQQRAEIGEAPRIARPEQRAVERADEVKKIVREPGGAQQDGRRVGRGDGKIARDVRRGSGVWRHGARGKAQRARRVGRGDAPRRRRDRPAAPSPRPPRARRRSTRQGAAAQAGAPPSASSAGYVQSPPGAWSVPQNARRAGRAPIAVFRHMTVALYRKTPFMRKAGIFPHRRRNLPPCQARCFLS